MTGEHARGEDLTVVIPTRDRWEILERTLGSLAAQSAAGFETIVVGDGLEQQPPAALRSSAGVRFLVQEHAGPGVARNLGAGASSRPLLLFLGDDVVPSAQLVALHLERHRREPAPEVAVLGHVDWHPEVADDRLARWLDWSGAQFDYRQLATEQGDDAGFGRFYSCNVSIKRRLFLDVGGFDPAFRFDYEDLDIGWRLHQRGMRLIYEPRAVGHHLHRYDWSALERRYASRARAERLMAAKHDWFTPWFHERIAAHASAPAVSPAWARLVDLIPDRAGRLRELAESKANRWYHQRLAPAFLEAWEAACASQRDAPGAPADPMPTARG